MQLPVVAIVGRPNVGKSSLFNRLMGRRISIVQATPGVTRDRVSAPLAVDDDAAPGEGAYVELVDTGGMGIEDVDNLTEHVENQIAYAIKASGLILFVVDAREGVTPLDNHVAQKLRRLDKPVVLLANKIDEVDLVSEVHEFQKLGFGEPIAISANHGNGIELLREELRRRVGQVAVAGSGRKPMELAIVGKRNAGKSTFINSLVGEPRVIASEVPGTTRDSVDVQVTLDGESFTLIDTAGLRKKRKIRDDVEYYAMHRALRSIRRADVVAMLIDASLQVSQVDKHLAGMIAEEFKPVLLVVNKWDLARGVADAEQYDEYLQKMFPELAYAPITLTSASEGMNVRETITVARQLYRQANHRMQTAELNQVIEQITAMRGPSHKAGTKPPKILYATQIATCPPTIVCFVNDVRSFDQGYQRFLVNRLREMTPFAEVPIRLLFRGRNR
ncbi:MAG: ribosome biogenesis GTPase Der [Phycisphaerae bacterium]